MRVAASAREDEDFSGDDASWMRGVVGGVHREKEVLGLPFIGSDGNSNDGNASVNANNGFGWH